MSLMLPYKFDCYSICQLDQLVSVAEILHISLFNIVACSRRCPMHFQVEEVQAEDEDEDNIKDSNGDKISADDEDRTGIGDETRGGADNSGIDSTEREGQSGQGYTEEITSLTSYVIPYF